MENRTEHRGSEPEKLQVYLVELVEKLVLAVETQRNEESF